MFAFQHHQVGLHKIWSQTSGGCWCGVITKVFANPLRGRIVLRQRKLGQRWRQEVHFVTHKKHEAFQNPLGGLLLPADI